VLAGAAAAAGISVALSVATLPLSAASRQRAKGVGLVTQDWGGWAADVAKSTGIAAVLWGGAGALIVVGTGRFGRRWWLPGAALVVAFGVVSVYAGPVVLDPVFNRFRALPEGTLRSDVLELAGRAGVKVGEVYDMDASRRTTAANAYVNGIGPTKRVVLFDTLLRDFTPAEVRGVVAHELGHVRYRDVPHGLLYLALVTPLAMLATARLGERLAPDRSLGTATAVPGVILAVALMTPPIAAISNQLSRGIERRADRFAMELTDDPRGLIDFQRRIAIQNVADVDPPAAWSLVFGTHPTTMERIGHAVAFEEAGRR
jgi:STE24 endopeptidase